MTTFSAIVEAKTRLPLRCVDLLPGDFADEWPEKPVESRAIGLRLIPEAEMQKARAEAAKKAVELSDDRETQIQTYNDTLMAWAVSIGTCEPLDVTKSWLFAANDNIPLALTSRAIRRLYDEIERLHIEASPLYPEASDAELTELAARLVSGLWNEGMTPAGEGRARRLLRFVLFEGA